MLIEYWRFERLMRVGPNPRSSRAMLSIRTGWPDAEVTVSLPTISMSLRWLSSTRTVTGYCSPASRYVVISSSPATINRSVLPMVAMRTPRSAARDLSTATCTSGLASL